jgi:hypothetical protein
VIFSKKDEIVATVILVLFCFFGDDIDTQICGSFEFDKRTPGLENSLPGNTAEGSFVGCSLLLFV